VASSLDSRSRWNGTACRHDFPPIHSKKNRHRPNNAASFAPSGLWAIVSLFLPFRTYGEQLTNFKVYAPKKTLQYGKAAIYRVPVRDPVERTRNVT
jgi:hypothetical protein